MCLFAEGARSFKTHTQWSDDANAFGLLITNAKKEHKTKTMTAKIRKHSHEEMHERNGRRGESHQKCSQNNNKAEIKS